jgi:hypothetical protein
VQVATTGTSAFKVDLVAMTITIDATSTIDAVARGFWAVDRPEIHLAGMARPRFAQGSTGTSGGAMEDWAAPQAVLRTHYMARRRIRRTPVVEERRSLEPAALEAG